MDLKNCKDDIAIIGMSARFPEAADYHEFWNNIEQGKSSITEIPENRWDWKQYYKIEGKIKNRTVNHWGGFMKNMETFDYRFFQISKKEADNMDPQQRLLMEESWNCLEDAGIRPLELSGRKIGVFIAGCNHDFKDLLERNHEISVPHHLTGSSDFVMANRLSYFYNFTGPSVELNTACSGSLATIHYGIQAIRNGECEMALVGAANVMIAPDNYVQLAKMLMLSPTGKVHLFDKDADGYVRGEGVGMALLKPLSKAIEDGDSIHGVIKATAMNHCGHTKSLTYPAVDGQAEVIEMAIREAGIKLSDLGYIELHGTGTPKGDPIEFDGIKKVFEKLAKEQNQDMKALHCALGSVKTNIGHLENAAGMASLVKVLMSMKNGEIVPSLNFERLNPLIKMEDTPFYLVTEKESWNTQGKKPRLAGISSFGLGGTNVHMVVEEYPEHQRKEKEENNWYLLALSGRDETTLKKRIKGLNTYLKQNIAKITLRDVSYTLLCGREHFAKRAVFLVNSLESAVEQFEHYVWKEPEQEKQEDGIKLVRKLETYRGGHADVTYRKLLEKVANAYRTGVNLDWSMLYGADCRKLHMPGYPFVETVCWVPECGLIEGIGPYEDSPKETKKENNVVVYRETWKRKEIEKEGSIKGAVIILLPWEYRNFEWNEKEQTDACFYYIEEAGSYQEVLANRIRINTENEEDYVRAIETFVSSGKELTAIWDLFALGDSMKEEVYYPAYLLKALWNMKQSHIAVLSAADFSNGEAKAVADSRIGFERTATVIMQGLRLRYIMVDEKKDVASWCRILRKEQESPELGSVRYEKGVRRTVQFEEVTVSHSGKSVLKEKGTYLITGGAGGLGQIFARYLIEKYHANVILTGRSSSMQKRQVLDELVALGTVHYIQADVTDKKAMQDAVKWIHETYHHLDGVIYAAGMEKEESILKKSKEEFEQIISVKMDGIQILEEILKDDVLDFVCYFSSCSAILGDFGSCDYAVANRYLNNYAEQMNAIEKKNRIAIDWPMWKNGGLSMKDQDAEHLYLSASGQEYLDDEEGITLFEQIIATLSQEDRADSHLFLLKGNQEKIGKFLNAIENGKTNTKNKNIVSYEVKAETNREQRAFCNVNRETELPMERKIMQDLIQISTTILNMGKEEFHGDTNFADVGYDSVNLGEFSEALSERYQIQLTPDVFFGYPTFAKLATYLKDKYAKEMDVLFAKEDISQKDDTDEQKCDNQQVVMQESQRLDEIAVVGMSGVFPSANTVQELWEILSEQKEVIEEIPEGRIDFGDEKYNKNGQKWRMGMVKNPAAFDPLFFDISPGEAQEMDPRQRLLLEETWKALEDAGMNQHDFETCHIGMFVGAEDGDYRMMESEGTRFTSNHNGILASRLAYLMNFSGPCMAINTACSSSLTAFHQAYLSLLNGDCDVAVVAGASLVLRKENYRNMANAGMISSQNRCFAFDERADGMVPADAVAALVLKKLSLAERDYNYIYGVVAGSGSNYDGKTNGITAPSGSAQAALYQKVYEKSGVHPKDISYIVTHGTGTKLGDPIEINALNEVFTSYGVQPGSCAITSVKPNIGHALAASGVVSIISLLLAMQHEMIPASINSEQESSYVHWSNSPLVVNRTNKEWKDPKGGHRIAGVSSFGMSGTNVHVLFKSYPNQKPMKKAMPYYLMVLSAKTETALKQKAEDLKNWLKDSKNCDLGNISYTLLQGRCHFQYRLACIVHDRESFLYQLEHLEDKPNGVVFGQADRDFYEQKREHNEIAFIIKHIHSTTESEYFEQLSILGNYYCMGYELNGEELLKPVHPMLEKLPGYAFDHKDYWYEEIPSEKILVPVWEKADITYNLAASKEKTVILCDEEVHANRYAALFSKADFIICTAEDRISTIADELRKKGEYQQVIWIQGMSDSMHVKEDNCLFDKQDRSLFSLYHVIKALLEAGAGERELTLHVVTQLGQDVEQNGKINPESAAIYGLCGVLAKEIPNWHIQVLDVEQVNTPTVQNMFELDMESGSIAAWRNERWYQRSMVNRTGSLLSLSQKNAYKKNGVYVVIGGAGDIGTLWTEYVVRNYHVQVIWIGRRECDKEIDSRRKQIAVYGLKPDYVRADVTDLESLQKAQCEIERKYGTVNGVIFSAVADFDCGIRRMDEEQFQKVVRVKAVGSIHVERVFGKKNPDFIVYFSSSSAFDMPLGQAGYVSGCCYADAFSKRTSYKKHHVSKVINWGFWGAVGAGKKMPESIQARIHQSGVRALEPFRAFQVLDKLLVSDYSQVQYMNCIESLAKESLKGSMNVVDRALENDMGQNEMQDFRSFGKMFVMKLMCSVLKISEQDFDCKERFEKYGIDSITILQLIKVFQKEIPSLESTVFYECQTTCELIEYMLEHHEQELRSKNQTIPTRVEQSNIMVKEHPSQQEQTSANEEDIAIIGVSARYPMADDLDQYWNNLKQGRNCVTEIPESRWQMDSFYEEDIEKAVREKKSYCKYGGFIDGFSEFDPRFFKISPREALTMDPQESLILQECYKVMQNAAYPPKRVKEECQSDVGVFVGITRTGFELYNQKLWDSGENRKLSTSFSAMANRVSYFLDLKGPSMAIDTMCSSSLTALHEACEHIRHGECQMALVATANVYTHPATYRSFCELRMLSPKGKCHAFGKDADGFVPGEGVAALLLKPLSKAKEDHDQIWGVIKATSANHDGRTNGFTVPNPVAQAEMIRKALDKSGINARKISYVEAHGTGTKLGDPIEINALTRAYRKDTQEKQYCAIGSVKTNIGHCEAAAGLAGVIKVLLQMKNKMLVPSLHSESLNPLIDFEASPFYVQHDLEEWKRPVINNTSRKEEVSRMAAVSAFGAGGSNAHVIIEEYDRNE